MGETTYQPARSPSTVYGFVFIDGTRFWRVLKGSHKEHHVGGVPLQKDTTQPGRPSRSRLEDPFSESWLAGRFGNSRGTWGLDNTCSPKSDQGPQSPRVTWSADQTPPLAMPKTSSVSQDMPICEWCNIALALQTSKKAVGNA